MNINVNTVNFAEICEGCLSSNRKLSVINDHEIREFYKSIFQPFEPINQTLGLCWECKAIVKRSFSYKKQVQNAHNTLLSYMLHQTLALPIMSRLTTHTNTSIHIASKSRRKSDRKRSKVTLDTNDFTDLPNKNETCKEVEKETEPVFIKVEEDSDLNYSQELEGHDFESFYLDERDGSDVDDKEIKSVLTPPYEVEKPKTKPKKTRKKRTEEFNDSDDEPLKKIKEEEVKPRRRRKKEKAEVTEDSKPAKKRGGKREKPPGVVKSACVTRSLQQLGITDDDVEMVVLTWEEVEAERQKALCSETYTRHQYRCEHCALGFNHRFKLDNHMAKHDPSAGELLCTVCKIRCQSQHALTAHRRRHRVRWRCRQCGVTWSRAGVAADHTARAHAGPPPTHTCAHCGHTAPSLSKLRNHLKSHGEPQKCELCGKTFRDKSTLKTHLFIHKGEKEHACGVCGKLFLFKNAMRLHQLTHDSHQHLYCHQCDMNFKNQMSYYQHMKYNLKHVDPDKLKYSCPLCDKRFMKASRLKEHNLAVHLKQTPVRCTVEGCAFACSSRPVLRSHVRMIHRNMRGVRNYVCHHCGKRYTNKKSLEGHVVSHTGERPHACGRCPATFRQHAALYNHTRLVHLRHQKTNDPSQWLPTDQSVLPPT